MDSMSSEGPLPIPEREKSTLIDAILQSSSFCNPVRGDVASRTLKFLFQCHLVSKPPSQSEIALEVYGPEREDDTSDRKEKVRHAIRRLRQLVADFFVQEQRCLPLRLEIPLNKYVLHFHRTDSRRDAMSWFWSTYLSRDARPRFGVILSELEARPWSGFECAIPYSYLAAYDRFSTLSWREGHRLALLPLGWQNDVRLPTRAYAEEFDWVEEQREQIVGRIGTHLIVLGHSDCMALANPRVGGLRRQADLFDYMFGSRDFALTMFIDPARRVRVSTQFLPPGQPTGFEAEESDELVLLTRLGDHPELILICGPSEAVESVCRFITSEVGLQQLAAHSEFVGYQYPLDSQVLFTVAKEEGDSQNRQSLRIPRIEYVNVWLRRENYISRQSH